jgi:fructose-bisphosphate aldolase/2-amino-3,7-dideoxy-D-threo-hept-6-ulosonate synthase
VKAGGAGVCMGRNAFQRPNTTKFVQVICKVVHENLDPKQAAGML